MCGSVHYRDAEWPTLTSNSNGTVMTLHAKTCPDLLHLWADMLISPPQQCVRNLISHSPSAKEFQELSDCPSYTSVMVWWSQPQHVDVCGVQEMLTEMWSVLEWSLTRQYAAVEIYTLWSFTSKQQTFLHSPWYNSGFPHIMPLLLQLLGDHICSTWGHPIDTTELKVQKRFASYIRLHIMFV
jgi:hypothetical protein